MNKSFDVFLSHNSKSKPAIRELAEALSARGLNVWLDEWELIPGRPWQEALEDIIETARSAAVLIGVDGLGPWQDAEMRSCLAEFVGRKLPVIPVLLPGAPKAPKLPMFLKRFTWVDLREGLTEEAIDQLQWGITGERPGRSVHLSISDATPETAMPAAAPLTSKTADRRMLFVALAGWALAWFLPAYGDSQSFMYGWQCFRGAIGLIKNDPSMAGIAEPLRMLGVLSPWTNFIFPVGIMSLHRGWPIWVRRNLAALLLVSFGINLVWLLQQSNKQMHPLTGYYLWLTSFLLFSSSAFLFLRSPGSSRASVLVTDP